MKGLGCDVGGGVRGGRVRQDRLSCCFPAVATGSTNGSSQKVETSPEGRLWEEEKKRVPREKNDQMGFQERKNLDGPLPNTYIGREGSKGQISVEGIGEKLEVGANPT